MPSDQKKIREAKKKAAAKSKHVAKKDANEDAGAEDAKAPQPIMATNGLNGTATNGNGVSNEEEELVAKLERDMQLNADARSCTGVLGIHPRSRDIKIDNFSITFHGVEILTDTKVELNCGRRYGSSCHHICMFVCRTKCFFFVSGLIGPNGSGKKIDYFSNSLIILILYSTLQANLLFSPHWAVAKCLFRSTLTYTILHESVHLQRKVHCKLCLIAMRNASDLRLWLKNWLNSMMIPVRSSWWTFTNVWMILTRIKPQLKLLTSLRVLVSRVQCKASNAKISPVDGECELPWLVPCTWNRTCFFWVSYKISVYFNFNVSFLDEPTNHLDLDACVWLEEELKTYKRILVIISHSQDFMNGICTNIIHLDKNKLNLYTGNYDAFIKTRMELLENQSKRYQWEQAQISHMKVKPSRTLFCLFTNLKLLLYTS